MREARYRLVSISSNFIQDMILARVVTPYGTSTDAPQDLEVVAIGPHPTRAFEVVAKCWSSEFEIVAEGDLIPELTVTFTWEDPSDDPEAAARELKAALYGPELRDCEIPADERIPAATCGDHIFEIAKAARAQGEGPY